MPIQIPLLAELIIPSTPQAAHDLHLEPTLFVFLLGCQCFHVENLIFCYELLNIKTLTAQKKKQKVWVQTQA
jgi:hypothetical protein